MNKIYNNDGSDTGLTWDDAPKWANFLITNHSTQVWVEGWETKHSCKALLATGLYYFDYVTFGTDHNWTLISERPKEQEWKVGDVLEFLGGKQYVHTDFFIKGKTYTIRDITNTGCNLTRGGHSTFWCNSTIKECFKNLTKQHLTKEENMNAQTTNTGLKPVRDIAHLIELMSKGRDVYSSGSKILSVMTRPEGSASQYSFVCYTASGLHWPNCMTSLIYRPLKTRRQYHPGDKAEDIVLADGIPVKVLQLIDLGADKTSYPLVLTIQDADGDIWSDTFNYVDATVEEEE